MYSLAWKFRSFQWTIRFKLGVPKVLLARPSGPIRFGWNTVPSWTMIGSSTDPLAERAVACGIVFSFSLRLAHLATGCPSWIPRRTWSRWTLIFPLISHDRRRLRWCCSADHCVCYRTSSICFWGQLSGLLGGFSKYSHTHFVKFSKKRNFERERIFRIPPWYHGDF